VVGTHAGDCLRRTAAEWRVMLTTKAVLRGSSNTRQRLRSLSVDRG
jgi:hypothetical protein